MALQPDTLLGPYKIQKQIGAGGMGEVYLAKDTRLGRTVALKVLPSNLAENEQLKQRLEREALAISHLSHPNICTLYDVGAHAGRFFLVMEFIEGQTLAAHLAKRKLLKEDVLRYGMQIADALDKAHRKGIIHRDLKPGNIMITKSGVKLLDFGLAKFYNATSANAPTAVSLLPTGDDLTAEGTVLGTLHYMAPEQLEGKDADTRTDLFALGAILYEMATGKKAFTGSSQASVIAAILSSEVKPVSVSEPMSPPQLDHVVQRCLEKNPDDRWQTASDVMHELQYVVSSSKPFSLSATPRKNKRFVGWILGFALLAIVFIVAFALFHRPAPDSVQTYAFSVMIPDDAPVDLDFAQLAVSPDGRHLVFVSRDASGRTRLWLRDLDSLQVRALEGTQGGIFPFWSPDSQWIGFFAEMKLKKLRITESQPQILCSAGTEPGGGTWNQDGVILVSLLFEGPLYKISENGGTPERVTTLDVSRGEANHTWPQFLPDQHHFLFHILGRRDESNGVYIGTLDSRETKSLIVSPGRQVPVAKFASPDYLLFTQGTDLMAQHFDAEKLELSGKPTRIAEGITRLPWSEALFSVEKNILAFRANVTRTKIQLTWHDRKGNELQRVGAPHSYEAISLSPDNRRVAVGRWESSAGRSIWLVDLQTGIETKFSFSKDDMTPVWSSDGQQLAFGSARDTPPNVYVKNLSGDEKEERLLTSYLVNIPSSWSPDGRYVLYFVRDPDKNFDIGAIDLKANNKQIPLIQTEFDELNAQFSADGKWIAYESNESGRSEIYVRPFLSKGGKWKVSSQGGHAPIWRKDGRELFYLDPKNTLMSIQVKPGEPFETEAPQPLFEASVSQVWGVSYAVSSDGNRFLIGKLAAKQAPNPPIHVLINWSQRLKN